MLSKTQIYIYDPPFLSSEVRLLEEMSEDSASEGSVCTLYYWILFCSPSRFLFQVNVEDSFPICSLLGMGLAYSLALGKPTTA